MRWRVLMALACLGLAASAASAAPLQAAAPSAAVAAKQPAQLLVMLRVPPTHYQPAQNYGGTYLAAPGREARRRIARRLAREHGLTLLDDWPMPALNVDCFVMQAVQDASLAQLTQVLAADPQVESVEPMQLFHVLGGQGDPLYPLQPAAKRWHLSELHALATGRNMLVAEVDSGVDVDHPDLRGQITLARNFVDDGDYRAETHGTEVAGIIAAHAGNGIGIAGIAPDAHLLALRACWQPTASDTSAVCSSFTLAKALQFALQSSAQIINLSLGGPRDHLLERLLEVALGHGITVIGAWDDALPDGGFPAAYPGVLAVAGEHGEGYRADVLRAPGEDIPATLPGANFGFVTGSSFAAAQVSGLVALLRELSPQMHSWQLHSALASASTLGLDAQRPTMIDACAAVASAIGRCACGCRAASATPPAPR